MVQVTIHATVSSPEETIELMKKMEKVHIAALDITIQEKSVVRSDAPESENGSKKMQCPSSIDAITLDAATFDELVDGRIIRAAK